MNFWAFGKTYLGWLIGAVFMSVAFGFPPTWLHLSIGFVFCGWWGRVNRIEK